MTRVKRCCTSKPKVQVASTSRTCTGGPSSAGDCGEGLGFSNLKGITRRTIYSATANVERTQAATRAHTYREEWLRAAACCCCMSTSMTTVLQRNYFSRARSGDEGQTCANHALPLEKGERSLRVSKKGFTRVRVQVRRADEGVWSVNHQTSKVTCAHQQAHRRHRSAAAAASAAASSTHAPLEPATCIMASSTLVTRQTSHLRMGCTALDERQRHR